MLIHARFAVTNAGTSFPNFRLMDPATDTYKPWLDFAQSFVTAHDILEHRQEDTGKLSEEFTALGVGFWLREESNHYENNGGRSYGGYTGFVGNMANDFLIVIQGMDRGHAKAAGMPPRYSYSFSKETEKLFMQVSVLVKRRIRDSWSNKLSKGRHEAWLRWCMHWVRYGYALGAQRYAGMADYARRHLFNDLKEDIKAIGTVIVDQSVIDIVLDTDKADFVMTVKYPEQPILKHLNVIA